MQCPRCNSSLEDGAMFCGNCGAQVTPSHNPDEGTTIIDNPPSVQRVETKGRPKQGEPAMNRPAIPQTVVDESFLQRSGPQTQRPGPQTPPPSISPPPSPGRRTPWRIALIAVVVLLVAAAGTIGATFVFKPHPPGPTPAPTKVPSAAPQASVSGQVAFFDNPNGTPGYTDALELTAVSLSNPPAGSQYDAWLINEQNEQIIPLGTLAQTGKTFTLNFVSGTGGTQQHLNLLGAGNKIEITQEQGATSVPSGKVLLSGTFPPAAFVHIRHLLFRFPTTPGNIGLLVGLLHQTQLLNAQALLLQSIAGSSNTVGVQCVAQSIIDISEGSHGANYHPLSSACTTHYTSQAGDGFGILGQGYASTAAQHAALAANQPDSTDTIRLHAHHVEIATDNIKGWVTTVDQDALKLLANPANTSVVLEIVALSDHAYHGVAGPDGQVNPVPGEAGAITAYIHGQYMAALPLTASA
jgi:hypothetical protein